MERKYMLSINRTGQQRLSRSTGTITKKTPTLHIGLPCEHCDYADHETTYDKKIVAGEEISSLTGCYSTPKCENLIVFSDEYFKKLKMNGRI